MSRRRTACSLRPFSRDAERGQSPEKRTRVTLGRRGDEDGVISRERPYGLLETRRIERRGEGVRGPRKGPQDDEIRRERAFDGVVLTKPAQPLDASSGGGCGRRRVGMGPVASDLHEPELDDVTRHRRLGRGEAHATERTDDVGLRGEPLLRDDTKQGLLTMMLARESVPHAAASNTVPTCSPARSRSTESTPRVATIAARHPAAAAMRQASTFGSMPPSIVPSSTSACAFSASSRAMTRPSFPRTPGTSVTKTSSRAPRLAAIAPAAASPFTLRISPEDRSSAAGATTGTRPASTSSSMSALSTRVTRPTNPSSASSRSARRIPPSMPVRPTAGTPRARRVATTRPFASPPSTASATSRVSASLTRRPRTKRVSMPRRSAHSPTSGPPPCTTTSGWPPPVSATTASSAASVSGPTDPPIFNRSRSLRGGVGIDPHVLGGEIGPPRARGLGAHAEIDADRDVFLLEHAANRIGVERARGPLREYADIRDAHAGFGLIHFRARAAGRGEDASPVRVGPVDRRLHEVRGRDRPRRAPRVLRRGRAAYSHLEDLGDPFAVGEDRAGQVLAEAAHRGAELLQNVTTQSDTRRAAPESDDRVVGAGVPVDADQVEAFVRGLLEYFLKLFGGEFGVGHDEGQQRGHVRVDHSGAFGDPSEMDRPRLKRE